MYNQRDLLCPFCVGCSLSCIFFILYRLVKLKIAHAKISVRCVMVVFAICLQKSRMFSWAYKCIHNERRNSKLCCMLTFTNAEIDWIACVYVGKPLARARFCVYELSTDERTHSNKALYEPCSVHWLVFGFIWNRWLYTNLGRKVFTSRK